MFFISIFRLEYNLGKVLSDLQKVYAYKKHVHEVLSTLNQNEKHVEF